MFTNVLVTVLQGFIYYKMFTNVFVTVLQGFNYLYITLQFNVLFSNI